MHFLTYFLVPQLVSALAISQRDDRRAAYFLDNNPAGSSIVSLKIDAQDGTLSDPVRTPTGGEGAQALTGAPPAPGAADPLFSQDSVVVSQNYLFTVNPGSNTVSMFFIDADNPWKPRLINTAPSLGEFPVSVAYSSKLNTACVLNGGAVAGVACFSTDHKTGLTPLTKLFPIPLGQTTPPAGPPGTASDILFNPSSTALILTLKGHPPAAGSIYIYPVSAGTISSTPIISSPSDLVVDFSLNFLGSDSRAVITDPSYGASIVDISPSFSVTVEKKIAIPGQGAACWSAYSARFNTIFVFDGGKPNITLIDPATGVIKGVLAEAAATGGSFDSAIQREFIYTLKGTQSIVVGDLKGVNNGGLGKVVQSLDLSALGSSRAGWTGLAVYPSV